MAYEQGDTPAYVVKVDDAGTYVYFGEAVPGTATSAAKWRIHRITSATGNIDWARLAAFNQIWDNRASLTYS